MWLLFTFPFYLSALKQAQPHPLSRSLSLIPFCTIPHPSNLSLIPSAPVQSVSLSLISVSLHMHSTLSLSLSLSSLQAPAQGNLTDISRRPPSYIQTTASSLTGGKKQRKGMWWPEFYIYICHVVYIYICICNFIFFNYFWKGWPYLMFLGPRNTMVVSNFRENDRRLKF